jgi:hypothetical protein
MSTSRRKMREASRSLAIAFNIGRAQEALYRMSAGQPLELEEKAFLEQLTHLFTEACHGFAWTQATVEGTATEDDLGDSRALRSLSLVLPIIRKYPTRPSETLSLLAEVSTKLGAGETVEQSKRTMFDAVLGALASHAGSRLDDVLEDRGESVSLSPLPE